MISSARWKRVSAAAFLCSFVFLISCSPAIRYGTPPLVSVPDTSTKADTIAQAPAPAPPDTTVPEKDIAQLSAGWLGTPYRYGGMSAAGIDCSGLVFQVVRQATGATLPRSSKKMHRVGRKISLAQVRPGDLLFFSTGLRGAVDHVGIYTGNGRFIHASTRLGVIESSLDDDYYRSRFISARRLFQ